MNRQQRRRDEALKRQYKRLMAKVVKYTALGQDQLTGDNMIREARFARREGVITATELVLLEANTEFKNWMHHEIDRAAKAEEAKDLAP
jgi:hypothetical protein